MKELIKVIAKCANVEYEETDFNNVLDLTYSYLEDSEMFTPEELQLITNINGYNIETLNDAIYSRFGYRDLIQFLEA
jgi:hypothetical protein